MINRPKLFKTKTSKKNYLEELILNEKEKPIKYDMSRPHQVGQFINHPKFGLGFIDGIISDNKVNVFFDKFEKVLLQNWITY